MERRAKIQKYLKQIYVKDIEMVFEIVVQLTARNPELRELAELDKRDFLGIVSEETGENIDNKTFELLQGERLVLYKKICDMADNPRKLKKQEKVNFIAEVLGDDLIFESFCISIGHRDEEIRGLLLAFGCEEDYDILIKDTVYQKRRAYLDMIRRYTLAAVNLYGVVHIGELEKLIRHYEKKIWREDGYIKEHGTYTNTVFFQPKYMCTAVLIHIVGNMMPNVCVALDGLVLHECFRSEKEEEAEEMIEFFLEKATEITEVELSEFFEEITEASFRYLFWEASEKERYIPSKTEFLRYADKDYREVSRAEESLSRYLERNYMKEFKQIAEERSGHAVDYIADILDTIHVCSSDVESLEDDRDPVETLDYVFHELEGFGIYMNGLDDANKLTKYVMDMANSTRLWVNAGCTPKEVWRTHPVDLSSLTLQPQSSGAAQLLGDGLEDLEGLGINLDLDGVADVVPMMTFTNNFNGTVVTEEKKIYPNDPCPCGSGKKYKKCCRKG